MIVKQIDAGGDRNFSYIVADKTTCEAAVIDPGLSPEEELDSIKHLGLQLVYIIATHDHFDHTGGNAVLAQQSGAQIAMFESAHSRRDISLKDGQILKLGAQTLTIIHTPGHTPDSICILAGSDLFTGDTLFVGKVGGTGFGRDARDEYNSLHTKLMTLPPGTRVWPGHDYGVRPSSTIGDELAQNPFIIRTSFEDFVDLKRNWLQYKSEHGIK